MKPRVKVNIENGCTIRLPSKGTRLVVEKECIQEHKLASSCKADPINEVLARFIKAKVQDADTMLKWSPFYICKGL